MNTAADRVEAFLDRRAKMNGLDSLIITGVADVDRGQDAAEIMLNLTVDDLRELVEKARLADAVRARRSIQRGFRRPKTDRLGPGEIDQRVCAPLNIMKAQDAGHSPKFERPTAISMVTQAPLGGWVEVEEWSDR